MHGDEACFRCAVVGEVARCYFAEDGCDCDDRAACFGGEHAGEEGADCVEVGDEVHVEVALEFLGC